MTVGPSSPRLLKGALVSVALPDPRPSVVTFQYNPDTLTRSFQPQAAGEGGDRSEAMRLRGAPVESIRLEIELDATDALERGDPGTGASGILAQLAALEILLYPRSPLVIANAALLATGTIEVVPPLAPFTLLVWSPWRILPVRVTELSVTEEAHDALLNPIRARASLGLRVLTYDDLPISHPGYHLFLAHQIVKETLASVASVNNAVAGIRSVQGFAG